MVGFDFDRRAALAMMLASGAALPLSACATSALAPPRFGAGKLYVTSWFGGEISVIDLNRGAVTKTIGVGVHDHNVFLSPDRSAAWVANNNSGSVSIIDAASDEVSATLMLSGGPRHTFFSPDGSSAYVTLEFDDAVAEVDTIGREVRRRLAVGHMPHFPIVVGDKLFVTNFGGASVSALDRASGDLLAHIAVGTGPLGASAIRDGARVLVACHNANCIAVIDVERLAVEALIQTDAGPVQVTVTPDQRFAYVANDGAGTVQKIDLSARAVVARILIGASAGSHGIAYAPACGLMFVTNTGRASVSVIDVTTDRVLGEISVGAAPEGVAFAPA